MTADIAARRVNIIQGEYKVVTDPNVVLTTILGSCVAACLRDPVAGVGGMNHFLLPGNAQSMTSGGDATRYGVHLMELLINGLLKKGARRDRLEAKIFGGAKTIATFSNVGEQNAAFAMQLLPTPAHRGRDLGLLNLTNTLPALLGPLLAWMLATPRDFSAVLLVLAALTLAGGLAMLGVRSRR